MKIRNANKEDTPSPHASSSIHTHRVLRVVTCSVCMAVQWTATKAAGALGKRRLNGGPRGTSRTPRTNDVRHFTITSATQHQHVAI